MRVLYCGDTQVDTVTSAKGLDTFTHSYFRDSSHHLRNICADRGIECVHIPAGEIGLRFPEDHKTLAEFDAIVLSDVGYNNFSLLPGNRPPYKVPLGPNRAEVIHDYVQAGGGLVMAGGWLTFSGLDGKGLWGGTAVEKALPVTCLDGRDDRVEVGMGVRFTLSEPDHPIVKGLPWQDDYLVVGYNRVVPKPVSTVVAYFGPDPALVIGEYGSGRSAAYTTDPGTHWGGTLLTWSGYSELWWRILSWTAGQLG
jgi:uncharacterized membrane protein